MLSPHAIVTPDIRRKLPGRGLWLRASRVTLDEAMRRNIFAKGFRAPAKTPADLADVVDRLLRKDAIDALSLANKAGLVITGYEKIRDAIAKGRVEWLLHARDAAASGCERLDRAAGHRAAEDDTTKPGSVEPGLSVLPQLFTAAELSLALGRENVVHVGLKRGEAARRFRLALLKAVAFGEDARGEAAG